MEPLSFNALHLKLRKRYISPEADIKYLVFIQKLVLLFESGQLLAFSFLSRHSYMRRRKHCATADQQKAFKPKK
jgi:hypothetical protein